VIRRRNEKRRGSATRRRNQLRDESGGVVALSLLSQQCQAKSAGQADWTAEVERLQHEKQAMREALVEILECAESFYTEGETAKRLPQILSPWAGPLGVIFSVARQALGLGPGGQKVPNHP
jgi:hypothetical protein